MDRFAFWPPIFWTLRIGILIVLFSGFFVFVLLVSRFFRLKTMRAMLLADPPRVESLGGEFAGAKAEVKLWKQVDAEQVNTLQGRVVELESKIQRMIEGMEESEQAKGEE
jgi:hypothetical protein